MVFYSGKNIQACVPLAVSREKSTWFKWQLSPVSVQDEIFTHPNCAEFRVSAETGLVQKLYPGRSPWAGGDCCFGSTG